MAKRGWTEEMIREAIASGGPIQQVNLANGNKTLRYVHPYTGKSVAVDAVTNEVIQVWVPEILDSDFRKF